MAHAGRPKKDGSSYDWRPAFLVALAECPVISTAARAADVNPTTVWLNCKKDPAFNEQVKAAMEQGVDRAEAEAFRRAVVGFEEPVIHQGRLQFLYQRVVNEEGQEEFKPVLDAQGQPVPLTIKKHSDALLAFYLKGRRKTFATERTELTGADGGPVGMQDEGARAARAAQLLALAQQRMESGTVPSDEPETPRQSWEDLV